MPRIPSAFLLDCTSSFAAGLRLFAQALSERLGTSLALRGQGVELSSDGQEGRIRFGSDVDVLLSEASEGGVSYRVTLLTDAVEREAVQRWVGSLREHVRSELRRGELLTAELLRDGGNADCFPLVPILRKRHLITCRRDDPAKLYDQPQEFFQCPGLEIEEMGDHLLVSRGLSAIEDHEFLKLALPQAWRLARAAKAGATKYGGPPKPEELELYQADPAKLEPVGYVEARGVAEYTCYLESGEHIAGWEIDRLHQMLREGRFSDGRPLRELRVSFPERAQAEREKRPLLDGGVKVLYMAGGAEHELTS